eukprot:jgi/Mesvir1/13105/Mv06084-RA.1
MHILIPVKVDEKPNEAALPPDRKSDRSAHTEDLDGRAEGAAMRITVPLLEAGDREALKADGAATPLKETSPRENSTFERYEQYAMTTILSRVIFFAKTSGRHSGVSIIGDWLSRVIKNATKDKDQEEITGLLLVYPFAVIHAMESTTPVLMSVLHQIKADLQREAHFRAIKVVSSTEDIPARAFKSWHTAFISPLFPDVTDAEDDETVVATVTKINLAIIRLGQFSSQMTPNELASLFHKLESSDKLPCDGQLVQKVLLCPVVPTLNEYLDIFDAPVDIDLDSDILSNHFPITECVADAAHAEILATATRRVRP